MRIVVWMLALLLPAAVAAAEDKPLVIPQVEAGRQGRIVGRAIACGIAQERTSAVLAASRRRMLAAVGPAFTEDRYAPELDRAIAFEIGLPKPSDASCAKAAADFEALEQTR